MISKSFLFAFLFAIASQASTLTLISGNGQVVPANTGQHGDAVVFQLTSGTTPLPGVVVNFSNPNGAFGLPLTALFLTTDSNGMVSVGFAPGNIAGISELFTLNASAPGSNVVVFYETVALFPPTSTALTSPATPAFYPYTASAQTAGAPISISIFGEAPLPDVALTIVPIPVAGVTPPPGTILETVNCLVNGALVPYVLTDIHGNATCAPVFSEPSSALNFKYNTGQFKVLIGGSTYYGPFGYNILVPPPAITAGPKNQVIVVGTPVVAALTASGGTPPFTFALAPGSTPLPAGVTLSANGQFAGTPTTPGIYPFTAQVTDALGHVATSAALGLSFNVSGGPLTFTPAAFEEAVVGSPYSQTITVTGGFPPYKLSTGGALPPGLAITFGAPGTNTFTVAGTPTTAGPFLFSVLGLDALNTTFQAPFPILVAQKLSVPGATLPLATLNTPYSFQLGATNGVAPFTFTSSSVPAGLTLSAAGLLSGTPSIAGLDSFSITVTDFYHETVMSELVLPVSAGTLTVAGPITLPAATAGVAYSQQIPAPMGGVPPYSYILTGVIPAGVTVTTTGVIMGTFTTAGPESIQFQVADGVGSKASGLVQFSVLSASPAIGGITNAASSLVTAVSPGEIVSIYGTNLGPVTPVGATIVNGFIPVSDSGVQVHVRNLRRSRALRQRRTSQRHRSVRTASRSNRSPYGDLQRSCFRGTQHRGSDRSPWHLPHRDDPRCDSEFGLFRQQRNEPRRDRFVRSDLRNRKRTRGSLAFRWRNRNRSFHHQRGQRFRDHRRRRGPGALCRIRSRAGSGSASNQRDRPGRGYSRTCRTCRPHDRFAVYGFGKRHARNPIDPAQVRCAPAHLT